MNVNLPDECPPLPADFASLLQHVAETGAPTGREAARVDSIFKWFERIRPGLAARDAMDNLVVDLSAGANGVWLLDAHTDTVFEDLTLNVTKNGSIWRCPGIADNTASVVFLMLLSRELLNRGGAYPLILSFTVGEEGEGDLRGIRAVGARLKDRLRAGWVIDLGLDFVTSAAVGSKRWRVAWEAPGGHSWGNFGDPSAIHAMGEWIAALATLIGWKASYLTYNVGRVSGGTTVNSLAEHAESVMDLRSVDPETLEQASDMALTRATEIAASHSVKVSFQPIGDRPAGAIPADPPLLDWIRDIQDGLGLPFEAIPNSTNANALLALGIPSTCTGLTRSGGYHTRDEWIDMESAPLGWKKLWKMVGRAVQACHHDTESYPVKETLG